MMSSHGYALHFSVILSNHVSIGGKCKGPCPEGDIGAKRLWEVSPLFSQVLAEWLQLHFKWPGCGASVPCLGYGVEGKPERAPLFGMFSRTQRKPPISPGSEAPHFPDALLKRRDPGGTFAVFGYFGGAGFNLLGPKPHLDLVPHRRNGRPDACSDGHGLRFRPPDRFTGHGSSSYLVRLKANASPIEIKGFRSLRFPVTGQRTPSHPNMLQLTVQYMCKPRPGVCKVTTWAWFLSFLTKRRTLPPFLWDFNPFGDRPT